MVQARLTFPRGFLWGTATSAHQVEGQNTNNDWSRWEEQPGRILGGHRSGRACDWWAGRWEEDFDRAAAGHQNAHRLSLEWSRIEPEPGLIDSKALSQYRAMLGGLRDREIEPMVTLHHFTNPLWLEEQGGWLDERVVRHFESYVRTVVEALGDLVAHWVTINEPNVYAAAAYVSGDFPPGRQDVGEALQVLLNMVRGHAAAYHAIHDLQPNALVGLAHHYRGMEPVPALNPLAHPVTLVRHRLFNLTVPDACAEGSFSLPWRTVEVPQAKGTQDFFGLNYYSKERVAFSWRRPQALFGRRFFPEESELSPTGFIANEPAGFWEALSWAKDYGLPVYVTENGVEDPDDDLRRRYLIAHLRELWKAANFNWRIKGYFHWSLVDNFEWERGWSQPFGLWALDPASQERQPRPSAKLYAQICQANALTSSMVEEFTPEIARDIFPAEGPGELGS